MKATAPKPKVFPVDARASPAPVRSFVAVRVAFFSSFFLLFHTIPKQLTSAGALSFLLSCVEVAEVDEGDGPRVLTCTLFCRSTM
jgi:hypothetical protein